MLWINPEDKNHVEYMSKIAKVSACGTRLERIEKYKNQKPHLNVPAMNMKDILFMKVTASRSDQKDQNGEPKFRRRITEFFENCGSYQNLKGRMMVE